MSRFKRLIENAQTKQTENQDDGPIVSSAGRFGTAKVAITSNGPFTQSDYLCLTVPCENSDCEAPILNIIEPEYDLEVGLSTSIPIELIFTELKGEIRKGEVGFWSRHVLATGNIYSFACPECDHENQYVICKDGGLLVLTVKHEHVDKPIPKDRIGFLAHPKTEWNLED